MNKIKLNYTHWLFDLDHTLLDFDKSSKRSFFRTCELQNFQGKVSQVFDAFTENSFLLWKRLEDGEIKRDFLKVERFRMTFKEFSMKEDPLEWSQIYLKGLCEKADLLSGAEEICRFLKERNCAIGLVTNGIGVVQEARMKNTSILKICDFMLTSDFPFRPKPAPDLFEEALRRWKNPPKEQVIMVGDNLICDIQGARNLGISTCWIAGGKKNKASQTLPTMTFPRVMDLLKELESSFSNS